MKLEAGEELPSTIVVKPSLTPGSKLVIIG